MPLVSINKKDTIESEYNAIRKLQEKCDNCKLFKGKKAKGIYTYTVQYNSDEKIAPKSAPAMLAFAEYSKDIYAVYTPNYLTDRQLDSLVYYILDEIEEYEGKLVVFFSRDAYDFAKKYKSINSVEIQLYN